MSFYSLIETVPRVLFGTVYFTQTYLVLTLLQALYELVKCDFDTEEALRRLRFNVKAARGRSRKTDLK